jgi:hypothetical protein
MAISAKIRSRLACLARSRRTRQVEFSSQSPHRWQPAQTTNPKTKQVFTEDAAWEFIADAIDSGAPIEEIILDKPPGKTGYVLKLPGANSTIYVKLQLLGSHVRGRSFHPSDIAERPTELDQVRERKWTIK